MSVTDEALQANQQYANNFDRGYLPMPPVRKLAVLTCVDARLHPEKFLGLDVGDAHVIHNAGGRVSDDALRSLIISSNLLGTNEYVVIRHTDCGMVTFANEDLRGKLAKMSLTLTSCRSPTSKRASATTCCASKRIPSFPRASSFGFCL